MILDANAIIHRAWHALPPLKTKDGRLVNALYGFLLLLFKAIKDNKPTYIAACFDTKAPTFRHKEYKEYKAGRVKQPEEFYAQIPMIEDLLKTMNITVLKKEGFEADDLIGTLSTLAEQTKQFNTIIVTGDNDALQLVDDFTKVMSLRKGVSDTVIFDGKAVKEKYGLDPIQLIDYKALRGDPSDNIIGIKGVGEKGATELLQRFRTLEKLFEDIKKNTPNTQEIKPALLEKLKSGEASALQSKMLATIVRNVPIDTTLENLEWLTMDMTSVKQKLESYEFYSLVGRLPTPEKDKDEDDNDPPSLFELRRAGNDNHKPVQGSLALNKLFDELEKQKSFAIDTHTRVSNPANPGLIGLSLAFKPKHSYYIPISELSSQALNKRFISLLTNPRINKTGHDLKRVIEALSSLGYSITNLSFDTMVASYLLNPGSRSHNLEAITLRELKKELPPEEDSANYYCARTLAILELEPLLQKQLKEQLLEKLLNEIELPLIPVLAHLEISGILVDCAFLKKLSRLVTTKINKLEQIITKEAGESFNLNSPLQLQHILFEKLKLPTRGIHKTKTGLSTSQEDLEKLKDTHPIINKMIEYRELAKLKSTYADALPQLINPITKRIHAQFNQTVTATGRLSSSDPNLQNIPIRTELGNEVRKAFIAPPGFSLLALDYSQIELRIIASISQDKKMIAAFNSGKDIHAATAAEIYGIDIQKVTPQLRRQAKVINFGVIYGLGSTGLAQSANMSNVDAKQFIHKYFETYSGIKDYIDQTKIIAASLGYVETLLGRRRYLPEIYSSVPQLKAQAERMAINMPIQGTAADLMKKAMIEVDKNLQTVSKKTRLLLQVHDELVLEVPVSDVKKVANYVRDIMENITKFSVPIEVHIKVGKNWGEMKKL